MATLKDKRVVVIGGTSGMGRAAVVAARAEGAEVIAAGRREGADAFADLVDDDSLRALFERVGELDHLLVTATPPGSGDGMFLEQTRADARAFVEGKLLGTWAAARWAAPRIRPGGSITFVTGGASVRPRPGVSIVSATFAALETLARALAIELGPIRVNAIRPGYTDSEMWDFLNPTARAELRAKVRAAMPVGRMGSVDDIGQAALFLMKGPQITGSVLTVDGGETLVNAL